jgi:hypothetical protein
MSTPPSNLKLRIGLSLASFTKYPDRSQAANKHLQTEEQNIISRASHPFLIFPKTHVYQLKGSESLQV